jgi:hypothetical protein
MSLLKKWLIGVGLTLLSVLFLVFIFISPIVKYLIEKNSIEWTGRQITIDKLRINPLTGTIRFVDFQMLEQKSTEKFIAVKDLSVSIDITKLIASKYDIKQVIINGLYLNIVQEGEHFNYDDILKKFSVSNDTTVKDTSKTMFWLKNLQVSNSAFRYENKDFRNVFEIESLNVKCPLIAWDKSLMNYKFDFQLKSGGKFNGQFDFNSNKLTYNLVLDTKELNLSILYPYLRPYIRISTFEGFLNTNFALSGNVNDASDFLISGDVNVERFAIKDTLGENLTRFESFAMGIDSINKRYNHYDFKNITCKDAYIKYETYDSLSSNWSRIMNVNSEASQSTTDTTGFSNPFVMLAEYLGSAVKAYLVSSYTTDSIIIRNAAIDYADYSLPEKFVFNMDRMNILTDKLNTKADRIKLNFDTRINNTGFAEAQLLLNPRDYKNLQLAYSVTKLPVGSFNPYLNYYVGWPFNKGDIFYKSNTIINGGKLESANRFQVLQPLVGDKSKLTPQYKMPVKIAVSILKDVKGNIDFDIPVKGDLNDPKFKVWKIVWKILGNLMIKAVTAPYNLLARAAGASNPDELKELPFSYNYSNFTASQLQTIDKLINALKAKSDLQIIFTQQCDDREEIELLATFEARKRYLSESGKFILSETIRNNVNEMIDSISLQDTSFISFLNIKSGTSGLAMPVQEKCIQLIGRDHLIREQSGLVVMRNKNFLDYLISHQIDSIRISINPNGIKSLPSGKTPSFTYEIKVPEEVRNALKQ